MPTVSLSEFKRLKAQAKANRQKRLANATFNALVANTKAPGGAPRPKKASIKSLQNKLWDLLTLHVKRRDGPMCKICGKNEGYALYHLIPQNEGNAVRYDLDNVVWGCRSCNCDENHHRARYARIHDQIFGKEHMDRLWGKARRIVQFRRNDYLSMIETLQILVGQK